MRLIAACLALVLAGPGLAQDNSAAEAARAAADRLAAAGTQLDEAEGARDRVKALTETVHAFESGLEAMRDGLRRAAIREEVSEPRAAIARGRDFTIAGCPAVNGQRAIAGVAAASIGPRRDRTFRYDPGRGHTRAERPRDRTARQTAGGQRIARSATERRRPAATRARWGGNRHVPRLSKAIADRTDLPQRFTEDPVKTALLIASTETLEGFASGLSQIATDEAVGDLPDILDRKGTLPLPVKGRILRRAGEADAAGIIRPGIVMATRPRALVSTPTAATVR